MNVRVRNLLLILLALGCALGLLWMRGRAQEPRVLVPSPYEAEQGDAVVDTELAPPVVDSSGDERGEFDSERTAIDTNVGEAGRIISTPTTVPATGTVRGEVRSDLGDLVPDCEVVLVTSDGNRTGKTNRQGHFSFPAVQAGQLRLYVEKTGSPKYFATTVIRDCAKKNRPWRGAQCLYWNGREEGAQPVVITLRSAAQVFGRIVDQKGAPVPGASVYQDHQNPEHWQDSPQLTTDAEGLFTLRLFPGEVHLRTSLSRYSDWTDLGVPPEVKLTLTPGQNYDLGDIVVGGGGASLVGRVTDANGSSASTITVVMSHSGGVGSMSTESAEDGSFAFIGVYPGSYQLAVAPDGAILGNPRRFLHEPGPVQEVVVSGEVGTIDLGEFALRFDGSFHLYVELVFADGHLPAWEDMRARALLPSGIELKGEDLEFQSRTKFEWHVREPDLFDDVSIEVSEFDPRSQEPLWIRTVNCIPTRHQRQRIRIPIE